MTTSKQELREKIVNMLSGDYACNRVWEAWQVGTMSEDDFIPLNETERVDEIVALITQTEKAYGGCHYCYGKGYATVNDVWVGYDTDTDIGSPGGVIRGGNPSAMKFCKCDRGQQLKKHITQTVNEVLGNLLDNAQMFYLPREDITKYDAVRTEVIKAIRKEWNE